MRVVHVSSCNVSQCEWPDGTSQKGKLAMADLAGSERTKKSEVVGANFDEV